MGLVRVS